MQGLKSTAAPPRELEINPDIDFFIREFGLTPELILKEGPVLVREMFASISRTALLMRERFFGTTTPSDEQIEAFVRELLVPRWVDNNVGGVLPPYIRELAMGELQEYMKYFWVTDDPAAIFGDRGEGMRGEMFSPQPLWYYHLTTKAAARALRERKVPLLPVALYSFLVREMGDKVHGILPPTARGYDPEFAYQLLRLFGIDSGGSPYAVWLRSAGANPQTEKEEAAALLVSALSPGFSYIGFPNVALPEWWDRILSVREFTEELREDIARSLRVYFLYAHGMRGPWIDIVAAKIRTLPHDKLRGLLQNLSSLFYFEGGRRRILRSLMKDNSTTFADAFRVVKVYVDLAKIRGPALVILSGRDPRKIAPLAYVTPEMVEEVREYSLDGLWEIFNDMIGFMGDPLIRGREVRKECDTTLRWGEGCKLAYRQVGDPMDPSTLRAYGLFLFLGLLAPLCSIPVWWGGGRYPTFRDLLSKEDRKALAIAMASSGDHIPRFLEKLVAQKILEEREGLVMLPGVIPYRQIPPRFLR